MSNSGPLAEVVRPDLLPLIDGGLYLNPGITHLLLHLHLLRPGEIQHGPLRPRTGAIPLLGQSVPGVPTSTWAPLSLSPAFAAAHQLIDRGIQLSEIGNCHTPSIDLQQHIQRGYTQ
ncbi:hypothetical protein BJD55_gp126 [Gordonia phage Yvonnetastic]|uniref:Uncharacterized protein n=1 Tax=Gordonia phage Yvonnetastic TaxID=1821566 RepID=A0A142K957_9CAUD|nr:hypothetical protein BJD55_gp126 [Gordonia phage Yvonnetastic]AMS02640.1 hypothetical protein SEA_YVONNETASTIC_96 [Gordonia phage Yvonnetastic]